MFFVNIPVGLAGVALAPFLVSESRDVTAPPRLDVAGTVLGLAILIALSAARTEALAGTMPAGDALVEGFRVTFWGAAGIAAVGIAVPLLLVRRKDQDV